MPTIDEATKWMFPDVTYLAEEGSSESPLLIKIKEQEQIISALNFNIETKVCEIESLKSEIANLVDENKKIKTTFENSLNQLSKSIEQINNSISFEASDLIREICSKVINHEISLNNAILVDMLNRILKESAAEGAIQVEVSPDAYDMLSKNLSEHQFKLISNKNLELGDIVVITNKGGLMMKVNDVIHSLLRT